MKTILLIDADILAFQHAAKTQRGYKWPDQEEKSLAIDDPEEACLAADSKVVDWMGRLKADAAVICLSCPGPENFRKDIWPAYKENRDPATRPFHLATLKQYLEDNYPSYRRPRLEADDIMGILSTVGKLPPSMVERLGAGNWTNARRIIVSEDKDMQTIPGWLWNPAKDKAPRLITEAQADYWHLYQTLVGDITDNYPGCPKVGPVKAKDALGTEPAIRRQGMWEAVVNTYRLRGLTESDALVQARVARILRACDYDFTNKEPILWQPTSAT